MSNLQVRIVRLEPLRVASAYGFGPNPEAQAWETLEKWLNAQKMRDNLSTLRFFGFNNPNPTPGSPNYGYEQWVTVGPQVEGGDGITVKTFPGGLYAVTRCELRNITEAWMQLIAWCEDSPHKVIRAQCLEECLTPFQEDVESEVFDLYEAISR